MADTSAARIAALAAGANAVIQNAQAASASAFNQEFQAASAHADSQQAQASSTVDQEAGSAQATDTNALDQVAQTNRARPRAPPRAPVQTRSRAQAQVEATARDLAQSVFDQAMAD